MNNKKRTMMFAALLAAVFLLVACPEEVEPELDYFSKPVDFGSHNTDYSILVRNNTSVNLVAFKGDLQANRRIGGIPAHAQNHGLAKDLTLFDKTEDFPMILITEDQYNANKDNLPGLKNTPFTRVYVFYNNMGMQSNLAVYEIAEGLGGNNEFKIVNNSLSINVELRVGGVAGETLGYAPAGIIETTLKLQDGNYNVFPVFKKYNAARDLVQTIVPKHQSNNDAAWFQSYSFGEGETSAMMNLKDLLQNISFTSGAAWVVVNNQTTSGGIRFTEGSTVYKTVTGLENIMTTRTFQIDMPGVGGQLFADSVEKGSWKFGAVGQEVGLLDGQDGNIITGTITIERDKMYTITVTGDHNSSSNPLKAWISDTTDIPASELGGW